MLTGKRSRADLAVRFREIRIALYGENGGPLLAKALGNPVSDFAQLRIRVHHTCTFHSAVHRADSSSPTLASYWPRISLSGR